MSLFDQAEKSAIISECEQYRYSLSRNWNRHKPRQTLMIIGLNPSTADSKEDDPTIRRCMGFADSWGYNELIMVNLFAFRSTDPKNLLKPKDPIGSENNKTLLELGTKAHLILVAWGTKGNLLSRDIEVLKMFSEVHCLGQTKNGFPKHPLYIMSKTLPILFNRG